MEKGSIQETREKIKWIVVLSGAGNICVCVCVFVSFKCGTGRRHLRVKRSIQIASPKVKRIIVLRLLFVIDASLSPLCFEFSSFCPFLSNITFIFLFTFCYIYFQRCISL